MQATVGPCCQCMPNSLAHAPIKLASTQVSPSQRESSAPHHVQLIGHRATRLSVCQASSAAAQRPPTLCSSVVNHDQLLECLSGLSLPELRSYVEHSPDTITLGFLEWLASREDQLEGAPKLQLAVLAGQLVALREGLDPYSYDEVADELEQHWQATGQSQRGPAQPGHAQPHTPAGSAPHTLASTSRHDLFPSTPSSLQQSILPQTATATGSGLQAFSQASIARQYEQVRTLNLDLEQARATSTVQLIGRKKIRASEYPEGEVSSAAQRILQYLLELPSAELRQEALPEAFTRPSEGSQDRDDASSDREDAETEQLSTTPLQLLQAVDLELAQLSKQSSECEASRKSLGSSTPVCMNLAGTLSNLRAEILDLWDAE